MSGKRLTNAAIVGRGTIDVDPAITFTCYYPKIPEQDEAQTVDDRTPTYHDVVISNLTARRARGRRV